MAEAKAKQCLDQCVPWVFTPAEIRKVKGGEAGLRAEDVVQQGRQSQGSWPSEEVAHGSDLDTTIVGVTEGLSFPVLLILLPSQGNSGHILNNFPASTTLSVPKESRQWLDAGQDWSSAGL